MAEIPTSTLPIPKCGSCGAPIVWVRTASGKAMPVDASSATVGDLMYIHGKHVSHFSSCPNASKHRRAR